MDGYSRLIAWLKVVLPLMALGLLSTLFLLNRGQAPEASIPFADTEIEERLRDQQITDSLFSGMTVGGDLINMTATKILTTDGQIGENTLEDLRAQIDTPTGRRFVVVSQSGEFSLGAGLAILQGDVVVTTSTGFEIFSDLLESSLDRLDLNSPGAVNAVGPFGTLDAGHMRLYEPEGSEDPHLRFTGGVKLIYRPKKELEKRE